MSGRLLINSALGITWTHYTVREKIVLDLPTFNPTEFTVTQNLFLDFKRKDKEHGRKKVIFGVGHYRRKNFLVVFPISSPYQDLKE